MDYKEKTLMMINLIKKKNSWNVMKHFFAQLSQIEELDVFPIVNAISSDSTDYHVVLHNSIMFEHWFSDISLQDIRNVVIFLLWKNHKVLVGQHEIFILEHDDVKYNKLKEKALNSLISDKLTKLLRNTFYISQINVLKKSLTIDDDWNSFDPFIKDYYKRHGLSHLVFFCFSLIKPLI